MKIKMNVHFQGRHEGQEVEPLQDGKTYNVPDEVSQSLADWLVSVRKASVVSSSRHYGSQPEAELKHDDELYAEQLGESVKSLSDSEKLEALNSVTTSQDVPTANFPEPENLEEVEKEIDATPSAVKLAEKEGVDLSLVEGTGNNGRITNSDIQQYLNSQKEG